MADREHPNGEHRQESRDHSGLVYCFTRGFYVDLDLPYLLFEKGSLI